MPAEWELQDAVWLSWPHNEETWPGMLKDVEASYVQFIKVIHAGQYINLLVNDADEELKVKHRLEHAGIALSQVKFHQIRTVDAWIRDYGPTFVVKGREKAMLKWTFNAWGGKYEGFKRDNGVPYEMNKTLKLPLMESGIILEGGSIEVNGTGTLLTTEQCLLNPNRNPLLPRAEIEGCLKSCLGVSNVLWLKKGIAGDDTDGHIDDIVRFVSRNTVVCCVEDDPSDENYAILKENYGTLLRMKDECGQKLNVIKLPMPGVVEHDGLRLPASYANFYIGNGAVAVPVFGHRNDQAALKIISGLFQGREVVGINCRKMVYGLGTLHCCSQQEPKI